ncbi:MAG TPA: hypothetical protein VMT46_18825 [Anaerolineaceae bacterium]|nr:hypothetical protein [Anaerolineaceae bacterium]
MMDKTTSSSPNHRVGFHYFPDTLHYRESDLQLWLPELRALSASWVILVAPTDRAIPEHFIRGLIDASIEPVIHFPISLSEPPAVADLSLFFEQYARWGVRYVILFDRPNSRSSWTLSTWAQEDLVERFLDRFIPVAEWAVHAGLTPVFPPLEPGGNYWDTAFLRAALGALLRRKQKELTEKLALAAYAWTGTHSLNWGGGGPERWPGARPYFTPGGEQDQRGFRIVDWYLAVAHSVLGKTPSILLLGLGALVDPQAPSIPEVDAIIHAQQSLAIARLLAGETVPDPENEELTLEALPEQVIGGCFWLLACSPEEPFAAQAWYLADGQCRPAVSVVRQWAASHSEKPECAAPRSESKAKSRPIDHYLLLPMYEWGVADWHLDIIRPFVKKHQPTIGFSAREAQLAAKVTVIGGPEQISDDTLDQIRSAGCVVERISGDGISIATILAER